MAALSRPNIGRIHAFFIDFARASRANRECSFRAQKARFGAMGRHVGALMDAWVGFRPSFPWIVAPFRSGHLM